ncbi:hypothetical protein ACFYRY_17935 [Streptomyces sp. NPDC005263]|uniref:hypothetical protein n=1 Tax=Streptomyces sp. NPDC005263 TaxID=3364711 RepID=UPI00368DF2B4
MATSKNARGVLKPPRISKKASRKLRKEAEGRAAELKRREQAEAAAHLDRLTEEYFDQSLLIHGE